MRDVERWCQHWGATERVEDVLSCALWYGGGGEWVCDGTSTPPPRERPLNNSLSEQTDHVIDLSSFFKPADRWQARQRLFVSC